MGTTTGNTPPTLDLQDHPTIQTFMHDNSPVRVVVGPLGSGKSTGVGCGEIVRRALMQEPSPVDNVRHFRALVVRNTLPDLRRTTVRTWQSIFPPTIGKFNETMLRHTIVMPPTKTQPGLNLLVEFIGLDDSKDENKLLSYEGTCIWFNEAKGIQKNIFDAATGRVGRYPSKMQGGVMPTWSGIIMDTNPYQDGHWLDILEQNTPPTWKFFRQPPGVLEMKRTHDGYESIEPGFPLHIGEADTDYIHEAAGALWAINPQAENLKFMPVNRQIDPSGDPLKKGGYYAVSIAGKDRIWIEVYIQGKNGIVSQGKMVIPEFDQVTMVSDDPEPNRSQTGNGPGFSPAQSLAAISASRSVRKTEPLLESAGYDPAFPLQCGLDFGAGTLNPAAVIGQRNTLFNRWHILKEVVCTNMGVLEFADQVIITLSESFPMVKLRDVKFWGDPAANQRDGVSANATFFDHFRTKGIYARPVATNYIGARIECIRNPMLRFSGGRPGFLVQKSCRVLIEALAGKWQYKRLAVAGEVRYEKQPTKSHPHSDVADALGYLLSGGGEHSYMTAGTNADTIREPFIMDTSWEPV